MATTDSRDSRSKLQRLLRLNEQATVAVLLLFVIGFLAVSLVSPVQGFWAGESEEAVRPSTGPSASTARLTIWAKATARKLMEVSLALAVTILVALPATFLWDLSQDSHVGQIARKILSSKMRFVFYLLFPAILAVLPITDSPIRGTLLSLSPEELAKYEAELLGATMSAVALWITWRLAARRILNHMAIAPHTAIDINTASKKSLESLLGIGPVLAQRIIEYREQVEPFEKIEDVGKVRGVGSKLISQMKYKLKVGRAVEPR
jgi:competence ComEA-like helix-hairpin-helix protein